MDDFEKSAINNPDVLFLVGKVSYLQDDTQDFPRFFLGIVEVRLDDGDIFIKEEKHQRGCPENPLRDGDVYGKFKENARRSLSAKATDGLMKLLMGLENLKSTDAVGKLLRGAVNHRVDPRSP